MTPTTFNSKDPFNSFKIKGLREQLTPVMSGADDSNRKTSRHNRKRERVAKPFGYPTDQRHRKHSNAEMFAQFVPLLLYGWPALYVIVTQETLALPFEARPIRLSVTIAALVSLVGGVLLVPKLHARSGRWEPTDTPPSLDLTEIETSEGRLRSDLDLLQTEYQEILAEARFRDKLLLRTSYFSLGVIGLLGAVFVNVPGFLKPFVLMLGSLILLVFVIAVNSYKDSRDALWDRAARIECLVPEYRGKLTAFNTVRQSERRLFNRLSLSVYAFGLITFMMILTSVGYLYVLFVELPAVS